MVCGMRPVRLVRSECGGSSPHRAVNRRPRIDSHDAALLPREHRRVEDERVNRFADIFDELKPTRSLLRKVIKNAEE